MCDYTYKEDTKMVNYKEILRLASEGTNQRQIAVSVGHSRDTVSKFLAAAKSHNLSWPMDESVTNEQIGALLFPERYSAASAYLEPDYPHIHSELAKRGVTLTLLWDEYRRKAESLGKKPYMQTQFGDKYPCMGTYHQGNDAHPPQTQRCHAGGLGRRYASHLRFRNR